MDCKLALCPSLRETRISRGIADIDLVEPLTCYQIGLWQRSGFALLSFLLSVDVLRTHVLKRGMYLLQIRSIGCRCKLVDREGKLTSNVFANSRVRNEDRRRRLETLFQVIYEMSWNR